jgi:hypothetical protein
MRYVRDLLVLRLNSPPSDELLAQINADFSDILARGKFKLSGTLPEEEEPEIAHLTRLTFEFNRRNLGRLRELIDCLNRGYVTPVEMIPAADEPPPES